MKKNKRLLFTGNKLFIENYILTWIDNKLIKKNKYITLLMIFKIDCMKKEMERKK